MACSPASLLLSACAWAGALSGFVSTVSGLGVNVRAHRSSQANISDFHVFRTVEIERMKTLAATHTDKRAFRLLHEETHQVIGDGETEAGLDLQRYLNFFGKGAYAMPYVYPQDGKWEMVVRVSGAFNLVTFDPAVPVSDASNALETVPMSEDVPLVLVKQGTWHSMAAKDGGAAMFKLRPGGSTQRVFSWQTETPWGYDENNLGAAPLISAFVDKIEAVKGSRASDPEAGLTSYQQLRPYHSEELLALLNGGQQLVHLDSLNPAARATLIPVRSTPSHGVNHPVVTPPISDSAPWGMYVWLTGGAVRIGDHTVGPDSPMIEFRGEYFHKAQQHGLRPAVEQGGVVLEIVPLR